MLHNNPLDNLVYLCQFAHTSNVWQNPQGSNIFDGGGPFYSIYQTKDKKYLAVACIEDQFYKIFVEGLPIDDEKKRWMLENHWTQDQWGKLRVIISETIGA